MLSISHDILYRAEKRGEIEIYKASTRSLVKISEIESWIEKRISSAQTMWGQLWGRKLKLFIELNKNKTLSLGVGAVETPCQRNHHTCNALFSNDINKKRRPSVSHCGSVLCPIKGGQKASIFASAQTNLKACL